MKLPSRFVMAGLAWNKNQWQAIDTESPTGYGYAKENPGHESLNFVFDKRDIDDDAHVCGYMPGARMRMPGFESPGFIFFHSTDYRRKARKIVGIYGNATRIEEFGNDGVDGFDGELILNVKAEQRYSMLFPEHLDMGNYFDLSRFRRANIVYMGKKKAEEIIGDEIDACRKKGMDTSKMRGILDLIAPPRRRASRISKEVPGQATVGRDDGGPPDRVTETVTRFARDTEKVRRLKARYKDRCQVCEQTIRVSPSRRYSEVHHLLPLKDGGSDSFENMLVLCPNHHVAFDYRVIGVDKDMKRVIDRTGKTVREFTVMEDHRIDMRNVEFHLDGMRQEDKFVASS